jgi:cobalamin biosynthesis protein CobD/CbiB
MYRNTMTAPGSAAPANQEQSVTQLVSGIVDDAQVLLRQQIALLKHEVRKDLQEAKQLSLSFLAGGMACAVSTVLCSFALVYLLNWLWPVIPLWAGFAIVGFVFAMAASILFYAAKQRLEEITPISDEAQQAIKENLQWTTKPK